MRLALSAAWLCAGLCGAQAAELKAGLATAPLSADPHFYNGFAEKALAIHVYSRLVEQTGDTHLAPGLASSWHSLSDTVWEFKLRPGVVFQDGVPLTPDDIVFSYARAPNVPNSTASFAPQLRTIAKIEITDPLTLRITTLKPNPNLPNDLANVAIVSRHAGEGATTADYNSGKAAIGTGPYRMLSFVANEQVMLERNPAWFGPKPDWDRVVFRIIANPGTRTAALLSGDVDLIDQPSAADLPGLRGNAKISVSSTPGTRMWYLRLDRSRTGEVPFVTDAAGRPLPKNPFDDLRVREALSLAINRQALADRTMQGTVVPTGQWLPPGTYSYNPAIASPPFDLAKAKVLLAEAGYPAGFNLTIHAAVNPEAMQAVAQMWSRAGVKTSVEMMPNSLYTARAAKQDFAVGSGSWGSNSGEAGYFLVNVLNSYDRAKGLGPLNWGRYSNPALDALTDRAMSTIDDGAREKLLMQAEQMAADDVSVIPLYQLVNFWASRKGIVYDARADERTVAMSAHPAK
jgi:peptide/nickel transport system substrate-binding protein